MLPRRRTHQGQFRLQSLMDLDPMDLDPMAWALMVRIFPLRKMRHHRRLPHLRIPRSLKIPARPSLRRFSSSERAHVQVLPSGVALSLMRPMNRLVSPCTFTRTFYFGAFRSIAASAILSACVPPALSPAEAKEPEPVAQGAIPWAEGETPSTAQATTRDVAPEPKEEEPTPMFYEDDGVKETSAGPVCSGKAPPALRASVDVRAHDTKDCSEKIPVGKAGASGDMKVSLRVAQSGQVEVVEILTDSLGVPEVTSCVKELFQKTFEVRPRGGCTIFLLPLHFESAAVEETEVSAHPAE